MNLEQQAPRFGSERAVRNARRPARIGGRAERLVAEREVAAHQIDLFPTVVGDRRGGRGAGGEAKQARAPADTAGLVHGVDKDLLPDTGRKPFRADPATRHIDTVKFQMGWTIGHLGLV